MKITVSLPLSCLLLCGAATHATAQVSQIPPPQGAAASAKPSAATTPDYRLVTGDKLRIEVYKDPQLSQSLQVRPDGKITLPLVGDMAAAGRTSTELRDAVAAALKDYITSPVVTVIVVETVIETVFVTGEVNSSGAIPIKGTMSIVQAIAMAGGFKDFAKTKDIKVLRRTATGTTTLPFNYKDAIKAGGTMLFLQPGDTVIVP